MRAAIAERFSGDAAPERLRFFRISVGIFTVYQPYIWHKRLFWSENLAVYCYSKVSFVNAV